MNWTILSEDLMKMKTLNNFQFRMVKVKKSVSSMQATTRWTSCRSRKVWDNLQRGLSRSLRKMIPSWLIRWLTSTLNQLVLKMRELSTGNFAVKRRETFLGLDCLISSTSMTCLRTCKSSMTVDLVTKCKRRRTLRQSVVTASLTMLRIWTSWTLTALRS